MCMVLIAITITIMATLTVTQRVSRSLNIMKALAKFVLVGLK